MKALTGILAFVLGGIAGLYAGGAIGSYVICSAEERADEWGLACLEEALGGIAVGIPVGVAAGMVTWRLLWRRWTRHRQAG